MSRFPADNRREAIPPNDEVREMHEMDRADGPVASTDGASHPVFQRLRAILAAYEDRLVRVHDTPENFYLDTAHALPNGKPLFFGAAAVGKRHVSFHLMPVYVFPELLDDVSDALRKRMQGKSCFNFRVADEVLFAELEGLARRGFERYREAGYVG